MTNFEKIHEELIEIETVYVAMDDKLHKMLEMNGKLGKRIDVIKRYIRRQHLTEKSRGKKK